MKVKILFFYLILFVFKFSCLSAQQYEDVYPSQFEQGLILKENYENILLDMGIENPEFYLAIVFPEMERFTEKRDQLETLLNKITYTTISDYEGFSIGAFQMKPSFVEKLEKAVESDLGLKTKYPSILIEENSSDYSKKLTRINRLKNDYYEVLYLLAFVEISFDCYKLFNYSEVEQIKYLSVIYNSGFKDSLSDYDYYLSAKMFPFGEVSERSKWNYSELCVHYYEILKKN